MRNICLKFCFLLLLNFGFSSQIDAQNPNIKFLKDSVNIGQPIELYLSFKHPFDQDVFFPKSKEWFLPFELVSIIPQETITANNISRDSVVYVLKTFETQRIQKLSLPIWVMINGDSSQLFSKNDTFKLIENVPDSLLATAQFKYSKRIIPNDQSFNTALFIRWSLGILLAILVFFGLLKRPLERLLIKGRFIYRHRTFTKKFRVSMKSAENLSDNIAIWKQYMESLTEVDYTKLSTSEVTKITGEERLGQALKIIDANIYGGQDGDQILLALQILYDQVVEKYKIKKKEFFKTLK